MEWDNESFNLGSCHLHFDIHPINVSALMWSYIE